MFTSLLKKTLTLFLLTLLAAGASIFLLEWVAKSELNSPFGWEMVGVDFLVIFVVLLWTILPDTVALERQKRDDRNVRIELLIRATPTPPFFSPSQAIESKHSEMTRLLAVSRELATFCQHWK